MCSFHFPAAENPGSVKLTQKEVISLFLILTLLLSRVLKNKPFFTALKRHDVAEQTSKQDDREFDGFYVTLPHEK